jgi:prepilin-type N-terminal cleavage/methylation domain-containing protein
MIHRAAKRGVSLIELLAATVVLSALITAVAQLALASAAQRQAAWTRMLAQSEVDNIAERLAAMPYAELTPEALQRMAVSPGVAAALDHAALHLDVADEPGPPAGKRVSLRLQWEGASGHPPMRVRQTIWRFRRPEAMP